MLRNYFSLKEKPFFSGEFLIFRESSVKIFLDFFHIKRSFDEMLGKSEGMLEAELSEIQCIVPEI